jgi:hypothetical protein
MAAQVPDDLRHHPAVDLVVALDLPHQLDLAQSHPAPACLRRGAPRPHHGPEPALDGLGLGGLASARRQ